MEERLSIDEVIAKLKKDNIRVTPQRQAILDYLIGHHSHPTADEIYHALSPSFPSMSVATVYNNLRLFTEIGLVQEMNYGDASSRFDFAVKPHYHAICTNCGKVVDFFYPSLEDVEIAASQLTGFEINAHRLEVYGLCPDCQKKEK